MAKSRIPKIENAAITHIKCVFADKEFVTKAKYFINLYGINENTPIDNIVFENELRYFVETEEFKLLTKTHINELKRLAKDFAIKMSDIMNYLNNAHRVEFYKYIPSRVEVKYWPPDGIIIKVPTDATKQDIIDQLDKVQDLQKLFLKSKVTKHKTPHDYKLIYAIFRARSKGLKFPEIFQLYQEEKLDLYKGSSSQYKSADNLGRFYRRYKP